MSNDAPQDNRGCTGGNLGAGQDRWPTVRTGPSSTAFFASVDDLVAVAEYVQGIQDPGSVRAVRYRYVGLDVNAAVAEAIMAAQFGGERDPLDSILEDFLLDPTPPPPEEPVICGNCGEPDHGVLDCVHPWADGFVHGCPMCNGPEHHSQDACEDEWPEDAEELYQLVVVYRANCPPLLAFRNWAALVMAAQARSPRLQVQSPWTPYMLQSMVAAGRAPEEMPWLHFDYANGDSTQLPVDRLASSHLLSREGLQFLSDMLENAPALTTGGPWDGVSALGPVPEFDANGRV